MRACGLSIEGKQSLVLGYGKVGRGIAHALQRRNCSVTVFDVDPIKRIAALSEGFRIPAKGQAFRYADIIFGATGSTSIKQDDFTILRDSVLLVSCSSRNIEFDLQYLMKNYRCYPVLDNLDRYECNHQIFYLAANGFPINFIDDAVIGPVLALVQAEIIISIKELFALQGCTGLFETGINTKKYLAEEWLRCFCNEFSGYYNINNDLEKKHRTTIE